MQQSLLLNPQREALLQGSHDRTNITDCPLVQVAIISSTSPRWQSKREHNWEKRISCAPGKHKRRLHFALVSQSHSFIYLMRSSLILSCNYFSRSVFFLLFSPPQSPPLRQLCFLSPTILCSGVYYRYFALYLSPELQKSEGRKNDDLRWTAFPWHIEVIISARILPPIVWKEPGKEDSELVVDRCFCLSKGRSEAHAVGWY